MATLTSRLVVQLIDQVTRPARAVAASIRAVGRAVSEGNRGNLRTFADQHAKSAERLRGNLIGTAAAAAGMAYALSKPLAASRDFESALTDIGQKSDMNRTA